jgi:UDP-4-amino-4,6-dideoxy-N-acetyl-beta-L-altrosamine transaminase
MSSAHSPGPGGSAASPPPLPYGRQSISEADIEAVAAVLRSIYITQGPAVERFEQRVAHYCGVPQAVAVCNATAGLYLACRVLGLGPGDRLWTSPNTFASANCARFCDASVDFVDIDPRTYNLSVDKLADKLAQAARQGTLPKVVVPVHFAGQCCDMAAIAELSRRYGFRVIEDAAHAIGAGYQGQPVGDCRYSDLTVFSFHPVKIITTGEGGMVLTRSEEMSERLIRLRSHGITRDERWLEEPAAGPWYYEQLELSYNFRMTDFQAALGCSQMERVDAFVARRRHLAARYFERLRDLPLILPEQSPDTASSWHLYVIRLRLDRISRTHRQVFEALRQAGLGVQLHYIPVHTQPYYRRLGFNWGDFPEAERYYGEAISLPLYYDLTESDQDRVLAILKSALGV